MISNGYLLGKIFISYSTKDKLFVSRIIKTIEYEGFKTWLDEKEIIAGDYLSTKIGEAIESSKVMIIVLSRNSLNSNWVKHELNHAVNRMIENKLRLIPIIIDESKPPPELQGIRYVSFINSYESASNSVLEAIKHEYRKITRTGWSSFRITIEDALKETFDSVGSGWLSGEYKSIDFDLVFIGKRDINSRIEIGYEIISSYGDTKALNDRWWSEFSEFILEVGFHNFILITQRPVEFKVDTEIDLSLGDEVQHTYNARFLIKRTEVNTDERDSIDLVILDFSKARDEYEYGFFIKAVKEHIKANEGFGQPDF